MMVPVLKDMAWGAVINWGEGLEVRGQSSRVKGVKGES